MRARSVIAGAVLAALIIVTPSFAWNDWKTYKTPHFTVFYKKGLERTALKTLRGLESQRERIQKLTGNEKLDTHIVVEDAGSLMNGVTNPVYNKIGLYPYPPQAGELQFQQDSITNLSAHEYTHMLQITNTGGMPWLLTTLFGSTFYPNAVVPLWAHEGMAVFSESDYSPFAGRLNDGFYDSYIGARVREKKATKITDATFVPFEYPLETGQYMYGGEFFDYIARTYGKERFAQFFKLYGKRIPVIELDSTMISVFGKTMPQIWSDWQEEETKRFSTYEAEGERVTRHGWLVENPVIDNGRLFYASGYPLKTGAFRKYWVSRIIMRELDTGQEKTVAESALVSGVSYSNSIGSTINVIGNKLYYLEDEIAPGFANESQGTYGLVSIIKEKDLGNGKEIKILQDIVRDFIALDGGNIIYSRDKKGGFGSDIVLYDRQAGIKKTIFGSDMVIDSLSSYEGRMIVSARSEEENYNLYELNLDNKTMTPLIPSDNYQGMQSVSGGRLLFVANYGKRHRLYEYDLKGRTVSRLTDNGYADDPALDQRTGDVYFVGLTSGGFDIFKKKLSPVAFVPPEKVLSSEVLSSEVLSSEGVEEGGYSDVLSLELPFLRVPMVYPDGGNLLGGLFLMGQDPVGNFGYRTMLLYDPAEQRMATQMTLTNNYFSPLSNTLSFSDIGQKRADLDFSYPLLSRITPGFSNLSLGLLTSVFSGYSRRSAEPYVIMGFRYPWTFITLSAGIPVERKAFGSAVDRGGLYARADLTRVMGDNEFGAAAIGIADNDNPDTVFPVIRGYTAALNDRSGAVYSAEIIRPLFRIRRGSWSDAFYLEDVSGLLFCDSASGNSGGSQLSAGGEIHLELKTVVSMDLGLRYSFNKDNQQSWTLLFKGYLPFVIN